MRNCNEYFRKPLKTAGEELFARGRDNKHKWNFLMAGDVVEFLMMRTQSTRRLKCFFARTY